MNDSFVTINDFHAFKTSYRSAVVGHIFYIFSGDKNMAFEIFLDEYWNWRLEQSPEFATKVDVHYYDDKWQNLTEETFEKDTVSNRHITSRRWVKGPPMVRKRSQRWKTLQISRRGHI